MDPKELIKGQKYKITLVTKTLIGVYVDQCINHRIFEVDGQRKEYAESFVKTRIETTEQ